ncbi:MAG: hypothetical protein WC358_11345, partial [Ignavibacteria bacterium]
MIKISELYNILPILIIFSGIILTIISEIIFNKNKLLIYIISILTVSSALVSSFYIPNKDLLVFNELLKITPVS